VSPYLIGVVCLYHGRVHVGWLLGDLLTHPMVKCGRCLTASRRTTDNRLGTRLSLPFSPRPSLSSWAGLRSCMAPASSRTTGVYSLRLIVHLCSIACS
jgi:hypothetical protein